MSAEKFIKTTENESYSRLYSYLATSYDLKTLADKIRGKNHGSLSNIKKIANSY